MKKLYILALTAIITILISTGCGKTEESAINGTQNSSEKTDIQVSDEVTMSEDKESKTKNEVVTESSDGIPYEFQFMGPGRDTLYDEAGEVYEINGKIYDVAVKNSEINFLEDGMYYGSKEPIHNRRYLMNYSMETMKTSVVNQVLFPDMKEYIGNVQYMGSSLLYLYGPY